MANNNNENSVHISPYMNVLMGVLTLLVVACLGAAINTWSTSKTVAQEWVDFQPDRKKLISDLTKLELSFTHLNQDRQISRAVISENSQLLTRVDKSLGILVAELSNLKDKDKEVARRLDKAGI